MRYVIKKPEAGYFTEFKVKETRSILAPMDMAIHAGHAPVKKGDVIGFECIAEPSFDAYKPSQAAQFDTEPDAHGQIANPDPNLGGPEAFSGCTVEPST